MTGIAEAPFYHTCAHVYDYLIMTSHLPVFLLLIRTFQNKLQECSDRGLHPRHLGAKIGCLPVG